MKQNSKSGFTLVELMIVVGILSVVIPGLLKLFIDTSQLSAMAGNKTLAISEAQNKIEEIRNLAFDNVMTTYGAASGTPFNLTQINGKGIVYAKNTTAPSNADLLLVEVMICWQDKYGRKVGEDVNLNGILDAGEDLDGDNKISSLAKLTTRIARR